MCRSGGGDAAPAGTALQSRSGVPPHSAGAQQRLPPRVLTVPAALPDGPLPQALPYPVAHLPGQTSCIADDQAAKDADGWVTLVAGRPERRPPTARNWLPTLAARPDALYTLLLRHMLCSDGFAPCVANVPTGAPGTVAAKVRSVRWRGGNGVVCVADQRKAVCRGTAGEPRPLCAPGVLSCASPASAPFTAPLRFKGSASTRACPPPPAGHHKQCR